jgi:predicted amidohydrolase
MGRVIQENLKRHMYFIDKVAADGAEFVGFPEMSLSGYSFSKTMLFLSLTAPEVKALQQKAAEKSIYVSAGLAEQDANGKKWNTHIIIDPKGQLLGWQHKNWLTGEQGFMESGKEHNVFDVKGVKMGISICADGSPPNGAPKETFSVQVKALVDSGAKIIYGPHCNNNKGTVASWYDFRSNWGGPTGYMARLKVYAALHNHAASFNPEFAPPGAKKVPARFSGGSWFIGPDGQTLAQMPASSPSTEYILTYSIPIDK